MIKEEAIKFLQQLYPNGGHCWLDEQRIEAIGMAVRALQEESVSEPNKELAETYLEVFDKKFPILPTLKGKQLADYKNFLNKCQQILGLKYWGIRPLQAKLFEKLSLLWAAWGAEHLQGLGQTYGDMDNEISMWSEEDDKMLEDVRSNFEYNKGEMTDALIEQYNHFFDKIKHLQPQPKQEWSKKNIGNMQVLYNK